MDTSMARAHNNKMSGSALVHSTRTKVGCVHQPLLRTLGFSELLVENLKPFSILGLRQASGRCLSKVVLQVCPLDGPCQPVATGTAHERAIIFLLTSGERVYG